MLVTHIGQYLDLKLTREFSDITKFTVDDYFRSIHAKSAYYSVYGPMQVRRDNRGGRRRDGKGDKVLRDPGRACVPDKGRHTRLHLDARSSWARRIGNDVKEGVKTMMLWHAVHNADSPTLRRLKEIYAKQRAAQRRGRT